MYYLHILYAYVLDLRKKLYGNLCKMIENPWKQYNAIVLQSRQKL